MISHSVPKVAPLGSPKLPVKNNIKVDFCHTSLPVHGVSESFAKERRLINN